ncbi:MAG: V-type H(+)-translocating pyrophosphatase [Candidatus Lambdaproteobacteria bacterium]|nr:V-type H(+)-translocating pyrophosphatase [Candidatus Lambdaproteobacteria bacterium]
MTTLWTIIIFGLLSIATAYLFGLVVVRVPPTRGIKDEAVAARLVEIADAIAEGAMAFLSREYRYMGVFMIAFGILVWVLVDFPSAVAFLVGASISILAGYIGMRIATVGNIRTTAAAQSSLGRAFRMAFNSGAVMGFGLTGLALLGLIVLYVVYNQVIGPNPVHVMEAIAGYGLGGSSIALFARVGGGIYTKAADVGADLVGKVEENIPEDDPRNPAVIADNVGDNVGDIAGMGADLFGSIAESTCAALVIGAVAFGANLDALLFPMLITAVGVPISLLASVFARAGSERQIEASLKRVLVFATIVMAVAMGFLTLRMLPAQFMLSGTSYTNMGVYISVLAGLIAGMLIGVFTELYTSHRYSAVRELARSSETGAATNIIYGLALGYRSALFPVIFIAITVYIGYTYAGMYGIAVASLGMLGTIAIGLTIDAFGPVADNAGGIAEMGGLGPAVRKRTDALDAAGNTTAAIGKGFAIGSAALTSLALFSAFLVRSDVSTLDMLKPSVIAFIFIGALLPFIFTSMTMKSVGKAALDMIKEVRRQFATIPGLRPTFLLTTQSIAALSAEGITREQLARLRRLENQPFGTEEALLEAMHTNLGRARQTLTDATLLQHVNLGFEPGRPDYRTCVDISTRASLREMIAPGAQVILSPIVVGYLFGAESLAGMLIGTLVAGVVLAISSANSGGAWDNAKKYIEAGALGGKGSDVHKAAVVGDTVGDPMKDTSGPSLNILIKLQAIISLVFAPFFEHSLKLLG